MRCRRLRARSRRSGRRARLRGRRGRAWRVSCWGANDGSIADRLEFQKKFLTFLFYRRARGADRAPGRVGGRRPRALPRRRHRERRAGREPPAVGTPSPCSGSSRPPRGSMARPLRASMALVRQALLLKRSRPAGRFARQKRLDAKRRADGTPSPPGDEVVRRRRRNGRGGAAQPLDGGSTTWLASHTESTSRRPRSRATRV
jgi:hypothetical protein